MTITLVYVALGGAIGAVLRYLTGLAVAFPFGTLSVNVLGSFLIGLLWIWLADRTVLMPFLMVGVLGGFTTFSAFSLDTVRLVESGAIMSAAFYVLASVTLSVLACFLAIWLARGTA